MRGECLLSVCNQKVTPDNHLTVSAFLCLHTIYVSASKIIKMSGELAMSVRWGSGSNIMYPGVSGVTNGRLPRYMMIGLLHINRLEAQSNAWSSPVWKSC